MNTWEWDGKWTVTIPCDDGSSVSFRVPPEVARKIVAAPALAEALKACLDYESTHSDCPNCENCKNDMPPDCCVFKLAAFATREWNLEE